MTALTAGATTGAIKLALQEIQDEYDGLKALIAQRFAGQGDLQDALNRVEAKPDSAGRQTVLEEELRIAMQRHAENA